MPTLKSLKKNVKKLAPKVFMPDMYTNVYGSVVISAYILTQGDKPDTKEINKKWLKAKRSKNKITWTIEDKDFIQKTLDYFGVKKPEEFPIAFVQGKYNCLFAPYIDGRVWPLREDGIRGMTLDSGKIYPIDWSKEGVSA